jgi:Rps23 Pro-64 3,4-dihydroxylase Tpa1-like proline 4-hydroxylase
MTPLEAKEKLKKDGYTWLELSQFNPEFYNFLLPFKCNEENNLKDKLTSLRCDAKKDVYEMNDKDEVVSYNTAFSVKFADDFETFEKASDKKEELVEIFKKDTDIFCSQVWYYNDLNVIFNDSEFPKYKEYIENLVKYYFDFEETQEFILFSPTLTYYDMDCELKNHSDGTGTGRVCALLIYLNEEYDENNGGYLVLNNTEKVIPTFGRVAIIDLQTFDIPHMVTKVTGGMGRYAMLSFIKRKEDEFIHNRHEMEHII